MRYPHSKTFCEFFAGIGLVHEGLRLSGWECVYANDLDPKKMVMYESHFGTNTYFHLEDVWETESIVSEIHGQPFLATASFPCTDLSLAGHRRGLNGSESGTFFGFINVLDRLNRRMPKLILLENVLGFLTSHDGRDFELAITSLAERGYWIDAFVLDAKHFVPQSRPRLFVVASHRSLQSSNLIRESGKGHFSCPWRMTIEESGTLRPKRLRGLMESITISTGWATVPLNPPATIRYSLGDIIDTDDQQEWWDKEGVDKHLRMMSDRHKETVNSLIATGREHIGTIFRRRRYGEMRAEVRFDGVAGCLRTAKGGSARQIVIVINKGKSRIRWMSPREYARLQGAPNFPVTKNVIQSLNGFGDAVCVPAIQWIDKNVLTPLFEDHLSSKNTQSKKLLT